jgi:hypothetical protein
MCLLEKAGRRIGINLLRTGSINFDSRLNAEFTVLADS